MVHQVGEHGRYIALPGLAERDPRAQALQGGEVLGTVAHPARQTQQGLPALHPGHSAPGPVVSPTGRPDGGPHVLGVGRGHLGQHRTGGRVVHRGRRCAAAARGAVQVQHEVVLDQVDGHLPRRRDPRGAHCRAPAGRGWSANP